MKNVTLVFSDDWEVCYVDNKFVSADHIIGIPNDVATKEALGITVNLIDITGATTRNGEPVMEMLSLDYPDLPHLCPRAHLLKVADSRSRA